MGRDEKELLLCWEQLKGATRHTSTDCRIPLSCEGTAQGTRVSHFSFPSFLVFLQLKKGLIRVYTIP